MAWKSLKSDMTAQDIKSLLKENKNSFHRVEQYRICQSAIFLPQKLCVPIDAIKKIQIRKSQIPTKNCCGMCFPVYNVVMFFEDEKPEKLMFEKPENAQKFANLILEARKNVVFEEYVPPYEIFDQ